MPPKKAAEQEFIVLIENYDVANDQESWFVGTEKQVVNHVDYVKATWDSVTDDEITIYKRGDRVKFATRIVLI